MDFEPPAGPYLTAGRSPPPNDRDEPRETFAGHSITVLTLDRAGIGEITTFIGAELLPRFGLPDEIAPDQVAGSPV